MAAGSTSKGSAAAFPASAHGDAAVNRTKPHGSASSSSPVTLPHAWAFAKARLRMLMSNAVISRRFIGASAFVIYAFGSYPLAEPTSDFSLQLAKGRDSVALPPHDAFAANVRQIAARVGVRHPEQLSIRISEETSGASVGSNATIRWRGACIVLPAELYEAFHATADLRQQWPDIPTRDEIDFVLAHESAHIARNHSIWSGLFLPASLVSCCYAIKKVPNKLAATVVGCIGLVISNTLLSWHLEHEADHIAATSGFRQGGLHCFERKRSRNCELRTLLDTSMITEQGNYLGDTSHPLLTTRIRHLQSIVDTPEHGACCASTPMSVATMFSPLAQWFYGNTSSCKYCLKPQTS